VGNSNHGAYLLKTIHPSASNQLSTIFSYVTNVMLLH